jgi:hypothetical protein
MKTRALALGVAALLLLAAAPAAADTTATSTITQIKVLSPADDNHRLFHGAIWLEYDKQTFNYRWGGAHCNGANLTDLQVSLLFAAFRSKYSITIDYTTREYKKQSYRCITGFTVTRS